MDTLLLRNIRSRVLTAALVLAAVVVATPSFAAILSYTAVFSGAAESPPNASPGTGNAVVTIDDVANTMTIDAEFSGLLGNTTVAHIHAATAVPLTGTAGVATTTPTFAGFPAGVTSGTYDIVLDLTAASSYNPSYVTAQGGTVAQARAALLLAISQGRAYFNIHTSQFGGGEIRGFLVETSTPVEAATWGRIKNAYR